MARRSGNQKKEPQDARSPKDEEQHDDPGRVSADGLGELETDSDDTILAPMGSDAAEEDSDDEEGVGGGDALVIEGATIIIEGGTVIIEGGTVTITGPLQMEDEGDDTEDGLDIDQLIQGENLYNGSDGRDNSQARKASGSRRNRS